MNGNCMSQKNNNDGKSNRWTLGLSTPMNSGDVLAVVRTLQQFCFVTLLAV